MDQTQTTAPKLTPEEAELAAFLDNLFPTATAAPSGEPFNPLAGLEEGPFDEAVFLPL